MGLWLGNFNVFGQTMTIVKGRVIDQQTGNPVPFANVYFHKDINGTITDFEGYYSISSSYSQDSIEVSYIGYKSQKKAIKSGMTQIINFNMVPDVVSLKEIVVYAGENPSFKILRNVIDHKSGNDRRSLNAYDCDSYNRIDIELKNVPGSHKYSEFLSKISAGLDSIYRLRDEFGDRLIPLFISETYSRYYVKYNPKAAKEELIKTRVKGIGINNDSYISQFLGSSFQQYNFYRNWLSLFKKDFISPIADGWRIYYDYSILDTLVIKNDSCFLLSVIPKNKNDLAFTGNIWITKKDYALKQIDVKIGKSANLNFINSIRIQQNFTRTATGPWIPFKTRITIDVAEPGDKMPGFIINFNNQLSNWVINKPLPPSFYNTPLELRAGHNEFSKTFWYHHRIDSLSKDDKMTFHLIDTLSTIPSIRRITELTKFAATGYIRVGKIDYGPALYAYSANNVEGSRIQLGFKTNSNFNDKLFFRMYGAYGFRDNLFKYGIYGGIILNRSRWTELAFEKKFDIDQVGIKADNLTDNHIFLAFTRFGKLIQPYKNDVIAVQFNSQFGRGFYYSLNYRQETFNPLYNFAYYNRTGNNSEISQNFINSSTSIELHYARDENFIINGNQRLSLGPVRAPAFTLQYTQGFVDVLGGDLNYQKIVFYYDQKLKLGLLGVSRFRISAGNVFGQVPYPVLFNHIGNETCFYVSDAFNTMNYSEFTSDRFMSLLYHHDFGGFFLNRVPLIKSLKWRLVGNANILWGHLNDGNKYLIPAADLSGKPVEKIGTLGSIPFIEVGYGIENIFKFIRIDAFHRITYLNNPNIHPFQIKITFQLIL